jgi:catechol 2,3-dioxygenase-like lactoylglutathione lyase family enzyme
MPPKTGGIMESSLYVADVARSVQFYERIFGFRVISDFEGRGCLMQAGILYTNNVGKDMRGTL